MPSISDSKTPAILTFAAVLLFAPALAAGPANTGIYINGMELSPQQMEILRQTTGVSLPPGHYLVQNGCIAHLESGEVNCAAPSDRYPGGNAYDYGYGGDVYDYGSDGFAAGGDVYDYGSNAYHYGGSAGSGYGYDDGSGTWFQRGSDYSGGYSVGGDGSGCIYTPDWSNC